MKKTYEKPTLKTTDFCLAKVAIAVLSNVSGELTDEDEDITITAGEDYGLEDEEDNFWSLRHKKSVW